MATLTPTPAPAAPGTGIESTVSSGSGSEVEVEMEVPARKVARKRDFGFLPIPKHRRHDPNLNAHEQFGFSLKMNLVLATAATVSVANLYYIQPMLVEVARDFGVSHDAASHVAVLAQGGYGVGILFVSPLGDLVRRRPLVLCINLIACLLTIGLALSRNIQMLQGLSFIVGMVTVTPQICIPWTADLAPSNIRARSMSITLSGLIVGLVIGRVLAGILATFASWRDTYWLAVGTQGTMTVVLWATLPDTPDKDIGISYFGVLWSMATYFVKYPTLVQVCTIAGCGSMVFAGFWTSTTFLLSDPPYGYSPFDIGLFGLLGIIGAILAPQWGRLVDRIVPWLGQITGVIIGFLSMVIALTAAKKSLGGVIVPMIFYDCGMQLTQVSSSYRVAGIDPKARARLNGCVLLCMFIGQTAGTAIMTTLYNASGWTHAGAFAVAITGLPILILLARGPHETGWFGWSGGSKLLRKAALTDLSPEAITEPSRRPSAVPMAMEKAPLATDVEALAAAGPGTGIELNSREGKEDRNSPDRQE